MLLNAWASEPHFGAHLAPIMAALPARARGTFWCGLRGGAARWAERNSVEHEAVYAPDRSGAMLVASFGDLLYCKTRPVALVEHGAGQTYLDPHTDRPRLGGHPRDPSVTPWLTLVPGPHAAQAHERFDCPVVQVGCPRLDPWHGPKARKPANPEPVIALSFRWNPYNTGIPEMGSAFGHFRKGLRLLADAFPGRVIGHGHPRAIDRKLRPEYERAGIPVADDFAEVLDRADLLMVDNSSVGPEWVSTGRPIVWLRPPSYRLEAGHGGRFYDWERAGPVVTEPGQMVDAAHEALADRDPYPARRRETTEAVYSATDGKATQRAKDALVEWVARLDESQRTIVYG